MTRTDSAPVAGTPHALTAKSRLLHGMYPLWKHAQQEIWMTLQGTSMVPTLPTGSRLRVRCGWLPAPGQIAAYCRGEIVVVHRLIEDRGPEHTPGERLLFRGDALAVPDPPVAAQDVIGVVVEVLLPSRWCSIRTALYRWARRHIRAVIWGPFRPDWGRLK